MDEGISLNNSILVRSVRDSSPFNINSALPFDLVWCRGIVGSRRGCIWITSLYIIVGIFSLAISYFYSIISYNGAFFIFRVTQAFHMIVLPPLYIWSLRAVFTSKEVSYILEHTLHHHPNIRHHFTLFCRANIILVCCAIIAYCASIKAAWYFKVFSAFMAGFYVVPYVITYVLFICILITYHHLSISFVHDIRLYMGEPVTFTDEDRLSDHVIKYPQNALADFHQIRQRYYRALLSCRHASRRWGPMLGILLFFAGLYVVYAVWNLYVGEISTSALIGYIVVGLIQLGEIGVAITSVNGAAQLVCRDIAAYGIYLGLHGKLGQEHTQDVTLFVQSAMHSRLEISFMGNFVLRTRMLMAVGGSIIAAVIPGIILR